MREVTPCVISWPATSMLVSTLKALAVAVGHAEAGVVPERVVVVLAVVDAVIGRLARAVDAVAAVDLGVVIEGLLRAVVRIDAGGLAVIVSGGATGG